MTRPPYRVPALTDLPEPGPFAVATTFAGGGGSSLGYRMAGFRVAYANEVVPEARTAYRANAAPWTELDPRDVREVKGVEVLDVVERVTGSRDLALLDGSPPCTSFSTSGKRQDGWGKVTRHTDGTHQVSDDLFYEYNRLVGEIRPQVFVAENVAGLVRGVSVGYFQRIMEQLRGHGYTVDARMLDGQWLGVPQARKRLIIIGVRDDLAAAGLTPAYPRPLQYRYSVRDALPWIREQGDNGGFGKGAMRPATRPSPTFGASPNTGNGRFPPSKVIDDQGVTRTLTLEELRRLCSFPDDFALPGTFAEGWARLGNAVPPVMAKAIGVSVRDAILEPWSRLQSASKPARARSRRPDAASGKAGTTDAATPGSASTASRRSSTASSSRKPSDAPSRRRNGPATAAT